MYLWTIISMYLPLLKSELELESLSTCAIASSE